MTNSSMYGSNPTPTSYRDIDLLVSTAENAANTAIANGNSATAAAAAAQASAGNASTSASAAQSSATAASASQADALSSKNAAATSATAAATSATAAASSASTAGTQANNAANSATAASNSATSANNSASAASTSATNAATSATAAGNSATNAATSATAAAGSASTATTQATAAAASNASAATHDTNAAASATLANDWATKTSGPVAGGEYSAKYNAQQAATSASGAATSATNAASSATSASGSATTATTQATAASTSATNAANSASAAAASATNAASSATAAASSASSAASAVSSALTSYYDKTASDARFAPISHTHTASQISDSTTAGRALLTAADAIAQRTSLGLGTAATQASTTFAAAVHTHVSTDITDSTSFGRALLTGASAAAQRTSLGLGTAALNATTDFVGQTATTGAASVPAGTTAQRPASPVAGQLRYNSTTGKFEGYGSAWGNIGGGATISDTAPSNPAAGDLWWRSSEGTMYVYYTDADSSQWVAASPDGTGQYLPLTGGTVTGGVNLATSSGNVGIGTSSPGSKLDVNGTVSVSGTGALVRKDYGYSSSYKAIQIGAPSNTSQNVALAVDVSTVAGGLFNGQSQVILPNNGALFVNAAGTNFLGAIARDSSNRILIGPNTSSGVTLGDLVIDSSGNVGIGTSSPQAHLDVSGSGTQYARVSSSTNTSFRGFEFGSPGSATSFGSLAMELNGGEVRLTAGYSTWGGFQTFYTNGSERMRIDTSGNLLVGTTSGLGKSTLLWDNSTQQGFVMKAATTTFNGSPIVFYNSSGTISGFIGQTASTVGYNTSSDYRLKHDVQPMTGGLTRINALKPVTYKWNVDDSDSEGFIAHELQSVIPHAVTGEKDSVNEDGSINPQGVDYSKIVVHLVAAMQEQQALIESLTTRIANLESK